MDTTQSPCTDAQMGLLAQALASTNACALSLYEIAKTVFLKGPPLQAHDVKESFMRVVNQLLALKFLTKLRFGAGQNAYVLFGREHATVQEIVCSLDPFAYVSHLSAMEYHGLTDRFPSIVFMSTPPLPNWRQQAQERMRKDLGQKFDDYIDCGLPRLTRLRLTKIGDTAVQFHERSQLGAFRQVRESPLRVATVGRVFLDMIREPHLCGGIGHVIDVFKAEAKRHLILIVDEIERNGAPIDKVRAGYLLDEVCKLKDQRVDAWAKYAQRGGSRKLDPAQEYSPHYSQRWQLSINVPSLALTDRITDDF